MKKQIDRMIPAAYTILEKVEIAQNGVIDKAWRGQIAAFGSALKNGSLLAAITFFSAQGGSEVSRDKLMHAIWYLLDEKNEQDITSKEACRNLFNSVCPNAHKKDLKDKIINCAIALKLAMNLYELQKKSPSENNVEVPHC